MINKFVTNSVDLKQIRKVGKKLEKERNIANMAGCFAESRLRKIPGLEPDADIDYIENLEQMFRQRTDAAKQGIDNPWTS